jgi:hypothetical protein
MQNRGHAPLKPIHADAGSRPTRLGEVADVGADDQPGCWRSRALALARLTWIVEAGGFGAESSLGSTGSEVGGTRGPGRDQQRHPKNRGLGLIFGSDLAAHGPQFFCRDSEVREVISGNVAGVVDDLDMRRLSGTGHAHGDRVRRLRACNCASDELGQYSPEHCRSGEDA